MVATAVRPIFSDQAPARELATAPTAKTRNVITLASSIPSPNQ